MHTDRRERVAAALAQEDRLGLVVTSPPNVRYLTGFTGEGLLLAARDGAAVLITDSRYELQAQDEAPGIELIVAQDGYLAAAAERLNPGGGSVAFEAAHLSYERFEQMRDKLEGLDLCPTRQLVEKLREIKDEGEQQKVRAAAALADRLYRRLQRALKPGADEKSLAWKIETLARQLGAEQTSFPPIVASGPRSAYPHAEPTDRRLEEGDQVKLDFGVQLDGYCSDITRTIFLGEPDAQQQEIYALCLRAQEAALAAARPGMRAADLDAVAREIIAAGGYGEQFGHGLGHGVGLQVHEAPRLGKTSEEVLQPGMVITIEPGIYLPGWGGVRIEDLVLITEDGAEVLSHAPKVRF